MLTAGQLLLIAAINFLAAFVQGATGFGYALVAMAIMPLFLPMQLCSAVSAVTVVTIGLQMSLTLRRHLRVKTIFLPVACCLVTINVGLKILDSCNEMVLRIILASLLVMVTALFFIMRKRQIMLPERWYTAAGAGFVTGLSTGMFNVVGPFLLVYYTNVCKDTLHLKASLEFSFLIAGLYSTCMHIFVYHNITLQTVPALTCSAVAAVMAGYAGLHLYRRINRDKIALVIYILMPVMALMLVLSGLR